MAQNLIDKKTLIGKSKKEIIEMLGSSENLSDVDSNEIGFIPEELIEEFGYPNQVFRLHP